MFRFASTGFILLPAPFSTNALNKSKINDGGNNQKLTLFNLGNPKKKDINNWDWVDI